MRWLLTNGVLPINSRILFAALIMGVAPQMGLVQRLLERAMTSIGARRSTRVTQGANRARARLCSQKYFCPYAQRVCRIFSQNLLNLIGEHSHVDLCDR